MNANFQKSFLSKNVMKNSFKKFVNAHPVIARTKMHIDICDLKLRFIKN